MVLTKQTDTQLYDQLNLEGNPGSPKVLRQNARWEDKTGASINVTTTRVARQEFRKHRFQWLLYDPV